MWREERRPWVLAAVACGIGVLIWAFWPPSVNSELRRRHIPEIPSYESLIGFESGGSFAHWLFLAVRVDNHQIEAYKRELIADAAEYAELGIDNGQVQIVVVDDSTVPTTSAKRPRQYFKQSLNGRYLDWWNIDRATRGDFFQKALPKACGYQVVLDREHGIIYVYWHYS